MCLHMNWTICINLVVLKLVKFNITVSQVQLDSQTDD